MTQLAREVDRAMKDMEERLYKFVNNKLEDQQLSLHKHLESTKR